MGGAQRNPSTDKKRLATENTEYTEENQRLEALVWVTKLVIAERRDNFLFSL
jgi:cell shape-determining protein MreC